MNRALALTIILTGLATVVVEFTVRAQVNSQLPPDQRIGIFDLQYFSTWLGRTGLIARHKQFYPQSRLTEVFRVLWGIFMAALGSAIVIGVVAEKLR